MTLLVLTALITLALTTLFSMAGVGAALILIPVFLAFGIELHTAMAIALLLNALGMTGRLHHLHAQGFGRMAAVSRPSRCWRSLCHP
jgi:hypothetical protein